MVLAAHDPLDTPALRKERGAFFTPPAIASFIVQWALRDGQDRVLEPSTGDAEFLVHAAKRMVELGNERPTLYGSELHEWSAHEGRRRVLEVGGDARIDVGDFFERPASEPYDAVIGNPPYIRFQDFAGAQRIRAREAALRGGVALSGLASAWAAFTIHAALQLAPGGRLGFVLPAELLSANYAGPVRRFLFEHFERVELVLFEERVFAEAETEAVLLLASGYERGSTEQAHIGQVRNASDLDEMPPALAWTPTKPEAKWSGATVSADATSTLLDLVSTGTFTALQTWGETTLGMVTGRNAYFALTPERKRELGLSSRDVLPLSPPGSAHLRGLELSARALTELGKNGKRTQLFRPPSNPSKAAAAYIAEGEADGVHTGYKCRVRRVWWQVPLIKPADLLLTYMNADTVRLVTNSARAHHLNSVHGVYLAEEHRGLGVALLPLAALNSVTMLSAEISGRAYGGGILKMEPGEADRWLMPSPDTVVNASEKLHAIRPLVGGHLRAGKLAEAVKLVDDTLLVDGVGMTRAAVRTVREARDDLAARREVRSRGIKD